MAKRETMYDVIFSLYGLKDKGKVEKEKYRKLIRDRFEKLFPSAEWEDSSSPDEWEKLSLTEKWERLSRTEKDCFVYVDIKEDMFKLYVKDEYNQKKIRAEIDRRLRESLHDSKVLVEHNRKIDVTFSRDYYKTDDDDEKKREAYNQFCKDMSEMYEHVPLPGFEEWAKRNEIALNKKGEALRIYDFVMDFWNSPDSQQTERSVYVSQGEIDHVVIQVLKKIVEKELGIRVDVPKIEKCLSFLKSGEFDEFQPVHTQASPSPGTDVEDQERRIDNDMIFLNYKKMLEELDFYAEITDKPSK